MIRKDKSARSYSSIKDQLIRDGFIPADSKDIPLAFIQKEIERVKTKTSALPSDIRSFIIAMAAIDTMVKNEETKTAQTEELPFDSIVMAGGAK